MAIFYAQNLDHNIEILYDDHDERAGVNFADMDLVGLPYQVVIIKR